MLVPLPAKTGLAVPFNAGSTVGFRGVDRSGITQARLHRLDEPWVRAGFYCFECHSYGFLLRGFDSRRVDRTALRTGFPYLKAQSCGCKLLGNETDWRAAAARVRTTVLSAGHATEAEIRFAKPGSRGRSFGLCFVVLEVACVLPDTAT